jgi:hypothetical protein
VTPGVIVLGGAMLGAAVLGVAVDGVAVAGAFGSPTAPFEVVVVLAFFAVSLGAGLVLGWLVTCAPAGIANAVTNAAASANRCVIACISCV